MNHTTSHTKLGILAIAAGAMLSGMVIVFAFHAFAFNGPSQNPPSGSGVISSDASNDIGIGTSTTQPAYKLLVVGSSSVTGNLVVGGTVTASNLGGSTISANNVSSGMFGSSTFGGNFSFPGNVGIGTASPAKPLTVISSGVASLFQAGSGGYSALSFTGDNSADIGSITTHNGYILFGSQNSGGTGTNGEIGINTSNNNVILGGAAVGVLNGNVGIGTTAPAYPLSVNGQVNATGYCISGANCITAFPTIATISKTIYDNAPTATDDIPFNMDMQGATILKSVECVNDNASGNTFTFNIYWGTTRSATTYQAFTSNQTCTSITTPTVLAPNSSTAIPAGSIVRLVMSAASSTGATVQIEY